MNSEQIKTAIVAAVCQHMPTAAIATGLVSPVDSSAFVRSVCERFPREQRPESLGFTPLKVWLKENGVDVGESIVMAIRHEWIMDELRHESQTHPVSMK